MLVYHLEQLKNYDYLIEQKNLFQFDSAKFYLDKQARLFFNSTNSSTLNEGVYYIAFKVRRHPHPLLGNKNEIIFFKDY